MKQQSLGATGFEKYRKKTRKESIFWVTMEQIIPWKELGEVVALLRSLSIFFLRLVISILGLSCSGKGRKDFSVCFLSKFISLPRMNTVTSRTVTGEEKVRLMCKVDWLDLAVSGIVWRKHQNKPPDLELP